MQHSLPHETIREDMRCSFWVSGACFKRLLPYHIAKNCPTCNRVRATNINQVHVFFVNFFFKLEVQGPMSSSLVNLTGAHPTKSENFDIFTARIRRMGKVMFSVCPPPWGGRGYPSLRFFPRSLVPDPFQGVPQSQILSKVSGPRSFAGGIPQSQVLSEVSGPRSFLGDGYPIPSQDWGRPPRPGQD